MAPVFYLGTHQPAWLYRDDMRGVRLFISANRLRLQKRWRPALVGVKWALDSGGFTEIQKYGRWRTAPERYVSEIWGWWVAIGAPDFCAPQDWMCEPPMLKRTAYIDGVIKPCLKTLVTRNPLPFWMDAGARQLTLEQVLAACPDLTADEEAERVRVHQARTVANLLHLRAIGEGIPFIPVLQGWTAADYLRHVDDYARAGVDLTAEPLVGVGSVCRRQGTDEITTLFRALKARGIRCHGFGLKMSGLRQSAHDIASADSMAWSFQARANGTRLPGCTHLKCNNCPRYALAWYKTVLAAAGDG